MCACCISVRGRGSEFTVRLPLAPDAHAVAQAERTAPAALPSPRRVLIADDNRDAVRILTVLAANAGPGSAYGLRRRRAL